MIQPHLPVGLPCYDFTPVTNSTLGILLQMVKVTTSGITSFDGVTGGVYKARERIHRYIADQRLLAIPALAIISSCRDESELRLSFTFAQIMFTIND